VEQNKLERLSLASIFKLIKILIARLKIIVLGAPLTNITDFAKMVSKHKRTSLFSQSVDVREKGFVPLTFSGVISID